MGAGAVEEGVQGGARVRAHLCWCGFVWVWHEAGARPACKARLHGIGIPPEPAPAPPRPAPGRYGLVRVRENAESIAFYGGEDNEARLLNSRLQGAVDNFLGAF